MFVLVARRGFLAGDEESPQVVEKKAGLLGLFSITKVATSLAKKVASSLKTSVVRYRAMTLPLEGQKLSD